MCSHPPSPLESSLLFFFFSITDNSSFYNCYITISFIGQGTLYFKSGARYEGEFKDGRKDGQGFFFFKTGSRYEGNDIHNNHLCICYCKVLILFCFFLLLTFVCFIYTGAFRRDRMHGQGTLFFHTNNMYLFLANHFFGKLLLIHLICLVCDLDIKESFSVMNGVARALSFSM